MTDVARLIATRLGALAITLAVSSMLIWGALALAPGTSIAFLAGGRSLPPETLAALERQYHLDEPLPAQYWRWASSVAQGDLGTSITYSTGVDSLIGARIGPTIFLLAYAALLVTIAGLGLGLLAALRGGAVGTAVGAGTAFVLGVPAFVVALLLIYVFSVELGWFPAFGAGEGFVDRLWHLTLPAIALALPTSAYVARVTRAAIAEENAREHVQTARARGIPRGLIVRRHVLRNAMIPIATIGGVTAAGLIAGAVVVENAFSIGGIGQYLVDAVEAKDFPVVQAICLLLVVVFVVISTIIDLVYRLLDPRVGAAHGAGR